MVFNYIADRFHGMHKWCFYTVMMNVYDTIEVDINDYLHKRKMWKINIKRMGFKNRLFW